jgi:PKD repeat protein
MNKLFKNRWANAFMIVALAISCSEDKDEPTPPLEANFDFATSATDPTTIKFTSKSIGAKSVSWDFDDGSAVSTETNPEHKFDPGTYSVTLTATAQDGRTSSMSKDVTVSDPESELKKLTGTTSKSWKLVRQSGGGIFPMEVGPQNRSTVYWSLGGATPLGERPCVFNDEFIFNLDGTYTYKTNGDVFADAGEFGPWSDDIGSVCTDAEDANFVGKNDADITAWNDGTHTFTYNPGSDELTVTGLGAFVGLQKVGTSAEVLVPQQSVTYKVVELVDADIDTLILEALHGSANYWRFVLVHYDDPADEPAIPGDEPPDDECVADANEVIEGSQGIVLTLKTAASSFGGFGGVTGGRVTNPQVIAGNESCYVNQYNRSTSGCETWGGAAINLPSAIDFGATTKKKFKLKVFAVEKLTDVVLRLEKNAFPDTEPSAERTATITAAGEWQEVTFDFSDITDPNTYKNLVIYFDRGSCAENVVYYFDDLTQID